MMASSGTRPLPLAEAPLAIRPADGALSGREVVEVSRTIGDLKGIFADEAARAALPQDRLAYRVQSHFPVPESTGGGLFFGVTFLEPGLVGDEYFMTKGHFHAKRGAAEYYWGIGGEGILLLMDEDRRSRAERIRPGSLHYVPGFTAHRTVNIGPGLLCVGACWPSDAGHDYESIARHGFSARVLRVNGEARVVEVPS
jgi:glucose-6-phosphate isomerase